MLLSVHQKILLRKTLAKYGININKLCSQVNSLCSKTRRTAREALSGLVSRYTGEGIMFLLGNPYTMTFKSTRSTLTDGMPRDSKKLL